jgi:hypothetical protein
MILVLAVTSAMTAYGREVYLFQAHAEGPVVVDSAGRQIVVWDTDAFFYNTGNETAQVAFLDDNAGFGFAIAPHQSASLSAAAVPLTFRFVHASVPDAVIVESALFIGTKPDLQVSQGPDYRYGKVRLPVFTSLTPANQPQVHLGTFLGQAIPNHENVWVYNGGESVATVHIEVRRQCDDAVFDERTVTVDPKGIVTVSGMGAGFQGCRVAGVQEPRPWIVGSLYTIVTVDQPSLSMVSTVTDNQLPQAMVSVN